MFKRYKRPYGSNFRRGNGFFSLNTAKSTPIPEVLVQDVLPLIPDIVHIDTKPVIGYQKDKPRNITKELSFVDGNNLYSREQLQTIIHNKEQQLFKRLWVILP